MASNNKTNKTEIVTFYIIACAVSWPLFFWRDMLPDSWSGSDVPGGLRNLTLMWGPGIAAIACFIIFRKTHLRTITWFGTSVGKSIAFYFLPFLVWFIISLINPDENLFTPGFFLELIPFGFLMILGEELGWRGYLQDALGNLNGWKKWLMLGLMWEFWHFTRGLTSGTFLQIVIRKLILISSIIILTYIIGRLTEKTKSLLVAITLHSWINIQFEFTHVNTQISGVICLIIWTLLIWKWNGKKLPSTEPVLTNH